MLDGLDDWDKGQFVTMSILLVVILAGALSLRGAELSKSLKALLAWAAIIGVIFVAATYRDDAAGIFASLHSHVGGEIDPAGGVATAREFRIRAREDGHFWVRAQVNGQPTVFLIDTGASDIVLGRTAAARAGLDLTGVRYDRLVVTANGAVRAGTVQLGTLAIGPITRGPINASVSDNASEANLLGMAFLRTLKAWRVEGDSLIITL